MSNLSLIEQPRTYENEKLGITKGYEIDYYNSVNGETNKVTRLYYAKCGYSSNEYSFVYNHVTIDKCMKCQRLLGLSKSQVTNRHEVLLYFLLDKDIQNYGKNGIWGQYHITKNDNYFKSNEFRVLKHGSSSIVAVRKGNIFYRNYEYTHMVGGIFGRHDSAFRSWDYIDTAKKLGLFDLRICDIPLDTLSNIAYNLDSVIADIEIIEPKQPQYYNYYTYSENLAKAKSKAKNYYMEDQFFKVTFEKQNGDLIEKTITKAYIWKWDETAKCLIEVGSECKNHQEGLLYLYPKTIKNRSGTKRQGEFFFEPTEVKFPKEYVEQHNKELSDKRITDKNGEKSNHYATRRIETEINKIQYVTGTVRHLEKDHRMLKLKKNVWYKVHQSNSISSWSINLRRGAGAD